MRNFKFSLKLLVFTFSLVSNLSCLDVDFEVNRSERNLKQSYDRKPNFYPEARKARSAAYRFLPEFFNKFVDELDARIVGGNSISIKDAPYLVSIQYNNHPICGGAIISEKHVLTAAHCTVERKTEKFTIRAGSSFTSDGGSARQVKCIFNHIGFNLAGRKFDIALLKLKEPLKYSETIQPVRLIDACAPPIAAGRQAFVSGWGYLKEGVPNSGHILQEVKLNVLENSVCQEVYKWYDPAIMICAGELKGGRDTCQGDSGGPLTIDGVLVGIVSTGRGCARPGFGGAYTSVAKMRGFIEYMMLF